MKKIDYPESMGKFALSFLFFLALSGCQTRMKRAFDEIKPGMDKGQVLDLIGGPRAVTRFHGRDRWIIMFYDDGVRYDREIHFKEGRADYVGAPYEPPPEFQAASVDQKNAEKDLEIYEELMKARSEFGQAAQEYEDQVRGQDKVRYVPRFEPIQ
jgi:outer membrane protein assembly factor BamE